jgi:predicted PolB exonuclease-like 3'-5' exonuclease
MKKLIIDIETIPNQNLKGDLKPQFNEDTVKIGNLKDQAKIDAKIESARAEFESGLTKKMSLEGNYCQILSIGHIELDDDNKEIQRGVIFNAESDESILTHFFDAIYDGQTIIGWNSKNFDIPVIRKRAIFNGIKDNFVNFHKMTSPYTQDSIDLMHEWNGAGQFGKMSLCADLLGIENKTGMDGSMIYDAYKEKKFQEIKDYNMQDCEVCLDIYNKIF